VTREAATARSRWVGRVLRDRWTIDERISRGGVGTVYAATHRNGSRAAIKVLHPEFARDPDTRSRFLQEGYAANQVNHPGVVRILDDDSSEDGQPFLVMELLEGEHLEARRVRKGGTLPLAEVHDMAEQLLDVLVAAHDKGIVHRDIKPENLFVTREGRLKVLDFGFAQMKSGFRTETTATGFLLGTPGFMSPEQAVGNRSKVDAQTDIWATGATLFTLISGEPVHDTQSAAEALVAAANYPARSLGTVTTGLAPRLVALVDRALAFDKAHRWPNARAMQTALREVIAKAAVTQRIERYSIPDREPVQEDPARYDTGGLEELDAGELESWSSVNAKKGPIGKGSLPLRPEPPRPSPPSERTSPDRHPADADDATLADPNASASAGPHADMPLDPTGDSGTLIMHGSPRNLLATLGSAAASLGPPLPRQPAPLPAPRAIVGPVAYSPEPPPVVLPVSAPPPISSAHPIHTPVDLPRVDPALLHARAAASAAITGKHPSQPSAGGRVLVFVAVVVATMIVVVAVGLFLLE